MDHEVGLRIATVLINVSHSQHARRRTIHCARQPGTTPACGPAPGADIRDASTDDAGDVLAERIIHFMKLMRMPKGLTQVGYTEENIPALVEGTLPQHRVAKPSPRPADGNDLTSLFQQSMTIWSSAGAHSGRLPSRRPRAI